LGILELTDVHTYYWESYILQGISLEIKEKSIVALLGRNGMGKTTIIRSIIGLTPPKRGLIRFKGRNTKGLPPNKIAQMGIGIVPQGRHIFQSLNVEENLTVSARNMDKSEAWSLDKVYSFFPILEERAKLKGNLLSGGEQQMLAISRALMTNPELLLMDEPSEGLAPVMVLELKRIITRLKKSKLSILLVEQNVAMALAVAHYAYIIRRGEIVYESESNELKKDEGLINKFLGIAK
jgi:branched-chain amino acid transport system ATP-binding protein